jgi:cytochrome c
VMGFATDDRTAGGKIEIHLDTKTGPLLGTGEILRGMPKPTKIAVNGQSGKHNLFFVFTNSAASGKALFALSDISFEREKPAETTGGGK